MKMLQTSSGGETARIWAWDAAIYEAACLISCDTGAPLSPEAGLCIQVGDCELQVHPVVDGPGCWTLSAVVPRQAAMDRALWHGALLGANAVLMRQACLAFGLGQDNRPVLLGQIYFGPGEHFAASRQLQLAYDVWRVVHGITSTERTSPVALTAIEEVLTPMHASLDPAAQQQPEDTEALMDGLIALGLSEERACQVAAAGRLYSPGGHVHFERAPNGRSLLMHIGMPGTLLDGTADSALEFTHKLMLDQGIAIGRTHTGLQLMARMPMEAGSRRDFNSYLSAFTELPSVLLGDTTVRDMGDSDFFSLPCPF